MTISKREAFPETTAIRLLGLAAAALQLVGIVALGFLPAWMLVPFAAGGLLAWAVVEYVSDRPATLRAKK